METQTKQNNLKGLIGSILFDYFNSKDELSMDKATLEETAKSTVRELLEDAGTDYLSAKIKLRVLQNILEIIDKETTSMQLNDLKKLGVSSTFINNIEIGSMETGVKFDFEGCNDIKWNMLYAKKKEVEGDLKNRQDYLKSLKQPTILEHNDMLGSPVQITVHPPTRTSSQSVSVKIK